MPYTPYFAYGSNLLTARLKARCPSATPISIAVAEGFRLTFEKKSADGSGKATMRESQKSSSVFGVIFDIADADMTHLDKFEERGIGYDRFDDFHVRCLRRQKTLAQTTYIVRNPINGLRPYDWYLALIVAGAREHGLPEDYIRMLTGFEHTKDQHPARPERKSALSALSLSGYDSVTDALDFNQAPTTL